MTNEEKRYIDLGPFFPRKPLATPPEREDGTNQSPAGLDDDDMATGSSQGASNSKMQDITLPAVSYDENGAPNRRV